jgi:hypothetical protein
MKALQTLLAIAGGPRPRGIFLVEEGARARLLGASSGARESQVEPLLVPQISRTFEGTRGVFRETEVPSGC